MADNNLIIQLSSDMFAPAAMSHHEGTFDLNVLKSGPDLYTFDAPLTWQVDITNTGDAFLVTGTVEGNAKTACARCADDAEVPLLGEIEGYFVTSPTAPADYEESDEDDPASAGMDEAEFDILPDDNKIDLEPLIMSALLLDVPLLPLCQDDCKGLCPSCGTNLNHETCQCSQTEGEDAVNPDNPFAALADLKLDD